MKRFFTVLSIAGALIVGTVVPAQAAVRTAHQPPACPAFALCTPQLEVQAKQVAQKQVTQTRVADLPANYCDGTLNWIDWSWPPGGGSWGAATFCGQPWYGDFKLRSWDNDYGGDCVSIWASGSVTGGYSKVPGTTACGYGIVVTSGWKSGIIKKALLVKHQMNGSWTHSFQFYNCNIHSYIGC